MFGLTTYQLIGLGVITFIVLGAIIAAIIVFSKKDPAKPATKPPDPTTTKPLDPTTNPPDPTTKPNDPTTKPPALTTKPPALTTKPPALTTKPPAPTCPSQCLSVQLGGGTIGVCKKYVSPYNWCGDNSDWGAGYVENDSNSTIDCRMCV